jgi:hypothetical protein
MWLLLSSTKKIYKKPESEGRSHPMKVNVNSPKPTKFPIVINTTPAHALTVVHRRAQSLDISGSVLPLDTALSAQVSVHDISTNII